MTKAIHYYRPHIFSNTYGTAIHRLTPCAVENKTATYKSSTHKSKVTCKRCLSSKVM